MGTRDRNVEAASIGLAGATMGLSLLGPKLMGSGSKRKKEAKALQIQEILRSQEEVQKKRALREDVLNSLAPGSDPRLFVALAKDPTLEETLLLDPRREENKPKKTFGVKI